MLANYLKIAWRSLARNKVYSAINLGGLAVGMAVALLIGLWIHDELSFDTNHRNYARIAQVMQQQTANGQTHTGPAIPFPLGDELRATYGSSFKYVVMSSWEQEHFLTYGDKKITRFGTYMDVDAPKMLTLSMVKGNDDGLRDPHSILLSASAAKALFGSKNPLNQPLKIDNKLTVTVTGVYQDLPHNAQFANMAFVAPWDLYVSSEDWIKRDRDTREWDDNSFQLFAQIADQTDFATVNARIRRAKYDNIAQVDQKDNPVIFLHPMADWHLRSNWKNGIQSGGLIDYVWLFGLVGGFVLLLACINFMNLSTARSQTRAKEIGIRKAVGSQRGPLIGQFLMESMLVVGGALGLALLLVQLVLPGFNRVADKQLILPWTKPLFWLIGLGFTGLTGLVAGSYPALYLSSFQPITVLKGASSAFRFHLGRLAALPRKVLVVIQFTVSLVLIIGTFIVYNQIQFSKNRPIGYDRNGLMMIQMKSPEFYGKFDRLRAELKNTGAVVEVAESSSPMMQIWSNSGGFHWPGKDPNLATNFGTIWVTHDYGKTVGWRMNEGRDLSRAFPTDSSAVILNEAAVKFMGVKNPVGLVVTWGEGDKAEKRTVIGVIEDLVMESPYQPVKPTLYFLDYDNVNWLALKLNPNRSASACLAAIAAVFKKQIPSAPFDYKFANAEFGKKFLAEERVGQLATFFAGLAIFISCLGLFGLASFVAEQRTKEIGIRKVLGASVLNLWGLLSKDFVVLVLIGLGLAIPMAWYGMTSWLQQYAYRTAISWWIFAVSGAGALVATLLTVSYQSIKAALMNPVKSLRSE